MNIKIEKVDINNEEVLNFIASEYLKMLLELNENMKRLYNDKSKSYLIHAFIKKYKQEYVKNDSMIYGAYLDDDIVGAAQVDANNYLAGLFVKEEYRNRLIGSRLLERLITDCISFGVIKVDAKIDSISLYERFSFKKVEGVCNKTFIPMELERGHYGK